MSGTTENSGLTLMLLGRPGVGKSASGNTIFNTNTFRSEASAAPVTSYCEKREQVVEGRSITIIDTPGIWENWLSTDEKQYESQCIYSPDFSSHVLLMVLELERFTKNDIFLADWIQDKFGQESFAFTIILFTRGDGLLGKNSRCIYTRKH